MRCAICNKPLRENQIRSWDKKSHWKCNPAENVHDNVWNGPRPEIQENHLSEAELKNIFRNYDELSFDQIVDLVQQIRNLSYGIGYRHGCNDDGGDA